MKQFVLMGILLIFIVPAMAVDPVTINYGNFGVNDDFTGTEEFDLTKCDIIVTYTLDMNAYVPSPGTEYSTVGLVSSSAIGYMASGAPFAANTDPLARDPDDRLVLGAPTRLDEDSYDATGPDTVVGAPIGTPSENFNFLFDRDGVSAAEALEWWAVDGSTYNTAGFYNVEIAFHAISATEATMFARINGLAQGIYAVAAFDGPPEFYPVGKTMDSGDITRLRVFNFLRGAGVAITNLTVTGCLRAQEVEIDVLPGSPTNPINKKSKGLLPVVILSSPDFDATDLDLETVFLEGAPVKMNGGKNNFWMVVPVDLNRDGLLDLLVFFDKAAMDMSGLDDGYADLVGETLSGDSVYGSDAVTLVGRGGF